MRKLGISTFYRCARRYFSNVPSDYKKEITDAAKVIAESEAIVITAGAGIGVDSGLPDFRGNEGFWKAYPPMKHLGISFQEMANPAWFFDDKAFAWGFYGHRLNLYRSTKPHKGFAILKQIVDSKPKGGFVFTSNVDGQFQLSGFRDDQIVEVHGSINHIQCVDPIHCKEDGLAIITKADNVHISVDPQTFRANEDTIPKCPSNKCSKIARPNILMFGDGDWISFREEEQEERYYEWLRSIGNAKLLILDQEQVRNSLAGTEYAAVPSARRMSESIAFKHQGTLIRINPREPEIPHYLEKKISIPLGSLRALESIYECISK